MSCVAFLYSWSGIYIYDALLPLFAETGRAMGRVDISCVALLYSWIRYIYMTLSYHYLLGPLALLVGATYETICLPLFAGTARAIGRVDRICVALLVGATYGDPFVNASPIIPSSNIK